MDNEESAEPSKEQWYREPGVIDHWFYGVFEGGGAKGVAYAGALLAMKEKHCWFKGVAGASAGAITAALIAAGLTPEEMEQATDAALGQLHTGILKGLRRLEVEGGYLPSEGLRAWLDGVFRDRIARSFGSSPKSDVTFAELYSATHIELTVVAADLSVKRQVILSHNETPNCVVADAVVASSSIPFAFPSRLLEVPEGEEQKQIYHHTIVDGGVWSNFPLYVFEDDAFRKNYKRTEQIAPRQVLGFFLKEAHQHVIPRGEQVRFVNNVPVSEFRAKEWDTHNESTVAEATSPLIKICAWALYPFSLLGRFANWKSGVGSGRWPTPREPVVRYLVQSVNGLLGGIYPPLFGIVACAVIAIGAWTVSRYVTIDQINLLSRTDWTDPVIYGVRAFTVILTLTIIAIAILVLFTGILGVTTNILLLRASRRILYGLITTYVAGPGAPEWIEERKNVIALPIPPNIRTLSFNLGDTERTNLIQSARDATLAKLSAVLADRS